MDKIKLKPCPFCGGGHVKIEVYDPYDGYQGDLTMHRCLCMDCKAHITRKDVLEVIEAWNTRHGVMKSVNEFAKRLKEYYSKPNYQPTRKQPIKHTEINWLFMMIDKIAKQMEGETQ